MRGALLASTLLTAACGGHLAHLEPAQPSREPPARADFVVGTIVDKRSMDSLGEIMNKGIGLSYEVESDRPVGPWLATHVRSALRETGLSGARGPSAPHGELAVAVVRFDLHGATWIQGVGVFDVALYSHARDLIAAQRITVRTTDLATDDSDIAWSQRVDRLARWSAIEIARWANNKVPPVSDAAGRDSTDVPVESPARESP